MQVSFCHYSALCSTTDHFSTADAHLVPDGNCSQHHKPLNDLSSFLCPHWSSSFDAEAAAQNKKKRHLGSIHSSIVVSPEACPVPCQSCLISWCGKDFLMFVVCSVLGSRVPPSLPL